MSLIPPAHGCKPRRLINIDTAPNELARTLRRELGQLGLAHLASAIAELNDVKPAVLIARRRVRPDMAADMTLDRLTDRLEAICDAKDDLERRHALLLDDVLALRAEMDRLAHRIPGCLGTPQKDKIK